MESALDKIRRLCTIALIMVIPVMLYSFYTGISWALNETILQPERWLNDGWVHPHAIIAPLTRWAFLMLWICPPLFGLFSYIWSVRALLIMRAGFLFDLRTARSIFWVGFWLSMSASAQVVAASLSPMIKSWHNPDGPLPLRFWFSSEDFALVFCGLGFILLGMILREAICMARENEEFV